MKKLGLVCRVRMSIISFLQGRSRQNCTVAKSGFSCRKAESKWVTDVTVYLFGESSICLDSRFAHSNDQSTIPYRIALLSMVTTMLNEALQKFGRNKPHSHSDQGWQYQHKQYQQMLREKGVRQSMSRKKLSGQCCDRKFLWAAQVSYCICRSSLHGTLQTGTDRISRLLQQPQNQGKAKGLAACNSETASPFGCLNNFTSNIV